MPLSTRADLASELVIYATRLSRAVRRAIDQPGGVRVLSLLDELGPRTVTELAAADRCTQPTMSGTVAALARDGLVTKRPHPQDARSSLVHLTDEGATALRDVRRRNGEAVLRRLDDRHTTEDLATAVAVLRDLLDSSGSVEGNL